MAAEKYLENSRIDSLASRPDVVARIPCFKFLTDRGRTSCSSCSSDKRLNYEKIKSCLAALGHDDRKFLKEKMGVPTAVVKVTQGGRSFGVKLF